MRLGFCTLLLLSTAAVGCQPGTKCSGQQYYDPVFEICNVCPMGSTFGDGTCQCKEPYAFTSGRCVLRDGAVVETPDSGSSATDGSTEDEPPAAPGCKDYCAFSKACFGDNQLAQSVVPDIISGIHADDTAACTSSCQDDLGNDGSDDQAIACVEAGREAAGCENDDTDTGLIQWLTLMGDCCRPYPEDAVCKSLCAALKPNPLVRAMADFCP